MIRSIFEPEVYAEVKQRLDAITEDSERKWGKMTPAQMMHHCQAPLNIMLSKNDYGLKPNWFAKVLFKKSLYNDKLWRKNLPTARAMKEVDDRNFETEKANLKSLIEEVGENLDKQNWGKHPAFGHFTDEQWGRMQYKHLDHHFRQFGV